MTCREKWEMEHPGEEFYENFNVIGCPSYYGYIPDIMMSDECKSMTCRDCWNREIPEESESKKAVEFGVAIAEAQKGMCELAKAIKDSGDRTEFESGAVRDMHAGKGRCDLMPLDIISEVYSPYYVVLPGCSEVEEPVRMIFEHIQDFQNTGDVEALYSVIRHTHLFDNLETMLLEVAIHFENGCEKYGENNWRKGIPAKCYIDSAIRHYLKCVRGDKDERHDRAFVWNILCCIWTCVHMPELNTYKNSK